MAKTVTHFPSSDGVIQTVAWIKRIGAKPVALHPASKAAVSSAYAKPGYKPPDDSAWRQNNYGVGILTGPRSGGPVDCDLDSMAAIYFGARFLPPTSAIFGRNSKPRSHYLYRVDTADFDKAVFTDPVTNKVIIEARGDGGNQTVMPGSVHEGTGEQIVWSDLAFPDIPTVPTAELLRAVRKVAIACLIAEHIWSPGYHNSPTKHLTGLFFYLDWSEDEVVELITAILDYTEDDDKSRIPTIRAAYKRGEAGKKISGAGVLRKEINNDVLVDKIQEWAGSPTVALLQEYNEKYCCVSVQGKFRVAAADVQPGEPPVFMQRDDFLNLNGTDFTTVEIDGKSKVVLKAGLWLKSPRRRCYGSVDFMPGQEDDGKILNLWGGWALRPDEADDYQDRCEGFLDLLFDVICGGDGDLALWLINWMANIVREPMSKSMTAPVIIGPEGAGKSLLVAYFGTILGPAYTVVTQDKHVIGSFNRHLAGTLLLHSEEALYGGDRKHASIIRSLITDEFRMTEPKGIDATRVRNYLRLILLSNLQHAAPAMPGDRRYTVIDMGARKASDELLARVIMEKQSTGPAALFRYLMEYDYDPKLARSNVKNASLSDLKVQNLNPLEAWWLEVLTSGNLLPDRLAWAQAPSKDQWPRAVGSPALHAAMVHNLHSRGVRTVMHPAAFNQTVEKMVGVKVSRDQRDYVNELVGELGVPQIWTLLSSRQLSWTNFPSLQRCRDGFDKYLGQSIAWPEIDGINKQPEQVAGPEY